MPWIHAIQRYCIRYLKTRIRQKWTGMKETSFSLLLLSDMTVYLCITDCTAAWYTTSHPVFHWWGKICWCKLFQKTTSQFPILIIWRWCSPSLQHCKSNWMNCLCVRLNCLQITLVDLMKWFLLPGNHVLFVVDHHNAALDILTYNFFCQGVKEKSASKV